jgi:photosystem II stability/assembly factor-like uncharacterized protein
MMPRIARLATALAFAAAAHADAQRTAVPRPTAAAADTSRGQPALFRSLRWRNIGPFRGGRTVAVTGDYNDPRLFYFGAVNGGVWKTTNGGVSWSNISDGKVQGGAPEISSVGAIAVAPSDPNVIYVGTGESGLREDLTYGTGVYRSTDAGETWHHVGLTETQQIGDVVIDPRDADRVFVAAMGHAFGPNAERGVFRTTDGGKSWKKVFFLDDSTGAIDLSMDPANSRIIYAAMWKFQRFPWGMNQGGSRSGLYKTTDGGETWVDISANPGLPLVPLGRIGVAVSPSNPRRVYASVEAPDSAGQTRGGIFRSDDAGATWRRVSADQKWQVRAWYYSAITTDPTDENTVYVLNLGTWRSVDGGVTWTRIAVPHGDCHLLWIDPKNPQRMIHANDGGATVSYDGGRSWSSIMNQPTAQFYHVTTDNQFPYRVYGAQQDNTTVSIASRSDNGAITMRDWFPVAGCENAYIAVDPRDANITYAGCYMGELWRRNHKTSQERNISVWLDNYDGIAAANVPNRFAWTYPVFLSPHDPSTLYISSQHVWRTRNEGQSWERISPDLSLHDPKTLGPSGGPIHYDMTGTEWYAMVFALAESPLTQGLLWAGTDDGLVHISRDGGRNWENITPKGLGPYTKMSIIEPSHFDPGTAYIAANRYQQDDFRPYLLKTTDYGKTWTRIDAGIPVGAYTRAIREDPKRRGLLYAGTEIGVYVSFDDGARWESLQLNLPRSSVRDLRVHDNDLIAATHGRSFWILDELAPLRQMTADVRAKAAHLLTPSTAVRFAAGRARSEGNGENPPTGVTVDYYLRQKPTGTITLEFLDAGGTVIRTFSSEESAAKPDSAKTASDSLKRLTTTDTTRSPTLRRRIQADSAAYLPADSVLQTRAGMNRFVWDLRYPGVRRLADVVNDEGIMEGPWAVPGTYQARLTVAGQAQTQRFTVIEDPRIAVSQADLEAQFALTKQVVDKINEIADEVRAVEATKKELDARIVQTKEQAYASRIADAANPIKDKLELVRGELTEVHSQVDQITLHYPVKLYNQLLNVNRMVQSADAKPTDQARAVYTDLAAKVDVQLGVLRAIESNEIAAFNRLLKELDVPGIIVGKKKGPIS